MTTQMDLENLVEEKGLNIDLNLFFNDVDTDWYNKTITNQAPIHIWEDVVRGDATEEQLEELAREYNEDPETILAYLSNSIENFRAEAYKTKFEELSK